MALQKERSKKGSDFSSQEDNSKEFYQVKESKGDTEFCGYDKLETTATLLGVINLGDKYGLVFDKTCFYGESGGQQGDAGDIFEQENLIANIENTIKPIDGIKLTFEVNVGCSPDDGNLVFLGQFNGFLNSH